MKLANGVGIVSTFLAAALGVLGCTPPGTRPHEMSVAGHMSGARAEDSSADAHRSQYDPALTERSERCGGGSATRLLDAGGPCWTSVTNPTEAHVRMAEQHRKVAAKHRAAAQALRDAEASACTGVSEYDRNVSPFAHREDIASVTPLTERVSGGKGVPPIERTFGARITFHDVPGLTVERLQGIVDCHLARNAALGHEAADMPYCPLVPNGVTAQVLQTESGHLTVEVRARDSRGAEDVWSRAAQLSH